MTPEDINRALVETEKSLSSLWKLLKELFVDPAMFGSMKSFGAAGFKLADHSALKMMVGRHKRAEGYLFKKYSDDKASEDQLKNYMRRIEGAKLLHTFIAGHGFTRVVVPQKYLYALPENFPARYLLVVEKLDLALDDKTKRNYKRIDKEQLRELATVLFYFRGLSSTASNLPFTRDGKIAFIDTERWYSAKDYLWKVGERIPKKRRALALDVYKELSRQGHKPFDSQFV